MPIATTSTTRRRSPNRDSRTGKSRYQKRQLVAHDEHESHDHEHGSSCESDEKKWCYHNPGGKGGWIETCPPDTQPACVPSTTPGRSPMETTAPAPSTPLWTEITVNDPDEPYTGLYAECDSLVPGQASEVAHVLILYEYRMQLEASANPESKLPGIEERLHPMLRDYYLDCIADIDSSFEVHAMSSLPADFLNPESCSTSDGTIDGTECVLVNGAITADIYYIIGQRQLQKRQQTRQLHGPDTLTDPFVIESFAKFFQNAFLDESGELKGGDDEILGFEFVGFHNMLDETVHVGDEDMYDPRTGDGFSAIGGGLVPEESEDQLIGGFAFLGLACMALVGVVMLISTKRRRTVVSKRLEESFDTDAVTGQGREMDVSMEGDRSFEACDDDSYDDSSRRYNRAREVQVVTVMSDLNRGRLDEPEGFEVQATLADRSRSHENMYATSLMDIVDDDEDDDEDY